MNWLDIFLLAFLAVVTFIGLWRGVIAIAFPLIGLIIGVVLAGQLCDTVGGWLPISNPDHARWAAYTIIIVVVLILAFVLARILRGFIRLVFLGWVDRLGGAILGLALGALVCAALLAVCIRFGLGSGAIEGSGVAKFLLDWFPAVLALLPSEFDVVRDFFR